MEIFLGLIQYQLCIRFWGYQDVFVLFFFEECCGGKNISRESQECLLGFVQLYCGEGRCSVLGRWVWLFQAQIINVQCLVVRKKVRESRVLGIWFCNKVIRLFFIGDFDGDGIFRVYEILLRGERRLEGQMRGNQEFRRDRRFGRQQ